MTWGGRLLKLGSETKEGPGVEEGTGESLGGALLWLLERYREAVSQGKLAVSSREVKATVTEGSQGRDAFSPRGSRRKGGPWGQGQGVSPGKAATVPFSSGCKCHGDRRVSAEIKRSCLGRGTGVL